MKSILCICIVAVMLLALLGCQDEKVDNQSSTDGNIQTQPDNSVSDTGENEEDLESWGAFESIVASNGYDDKKIYIHFPYNPGIKESAGKVAVQADGSLVILGSQRSTLAPEVPGDNVENMFPIYLDEHLVEIIDFYRYDYYDNFTFSIDKKEMKSVNGYEMCKIVGTHSFSVEDELFDMHYVAYGTKLKSNGAYVYWIILDETKDQSLTAAIEVNADKMALTFKE